MTAQESAFVSPWFDCFAKNYDVLKQIGPQIPATLRPAYDALLRSGATIQATIDDGHTVQSDDAKQWLVTEKTFAGKLNNARSAEIAANSD